MIQKFKERRERSNIMSRKLTITKYIGEVKFMADLSYKDDKICTSIYLPEVIHETDGITIEDLVEFLLNVKNVKENFKIEETLRNQLFGNE